MENSWKSSSRIFLHVGCDVSSLLVPSKALLYGYLCPANSPFLMRADIWDFSQAEKLFSSLGGSGSVWHQEPRHAGLQRGLTTLRAGTQPRGKEKPGCFGFPTEIRAGAEQFSKTFL